MRVMLLPGIDGEVPLSVQNYHHHLAQNLQDACRGDVVVESWAPRFPRLPRNRRLRANYLDVAKLLFVPGQLRRLRADVFHVLDHSHGAWVRALGARSAVVTCHDLIPFIRPEMWRTRWSRGFGRRMFTLNVRGMLEARTVIAVSRSTRDDIERWLGTRQASVTVVPMGVDLSVFVPASGAARTLARERLELPAEGRILLHVGSCDHYKNVGGVLEVLARVRRELPEVFLAKAGAPFRAEDEARIESLQLAPAILRLGKLTTTDLVAAYHAADALLFPSLYEGFGLPVLEAMACGTPVVASRAGALPEVAGDAAVLCDPDDEEAMAAAIVNLLRSRDERERLSRRGVGRAGEFDWRRTAHLTFQCYQEVQGERSQSYAAAKYDRP